MDVSERFEQLIAFITSQLTQPVEELQDGDGSVLFTGGDPPEVIVQLTDLSVAVSEFGGEWNASRFTLAPQLVGEVYWRTLPEAALMKALAALIRGARDARRSKYRTCPACGETIPPESFGAGEVCDSCADEPPGTIH